MKIHPVVHDLKQPLFCGPACIASITSLKTSEVIGKINYFRKKERTQGVRSMYLYLMSEVLFRLGYYFVKSYFRNSTVLKEALFSKDLENENAVFILSSDTHVVACGDGELCDNFSLTPNTAIGWRARQLPIYPITKITRYERNVT